ncbi:stage VI sporulation protein F [Acinetobacter baumannii]|uniref:stage VI sporulation protein F n=1 Tax=Acinetobacter baumannii TaxID=470 RepID=UPI0034D7A9CB
MDNEQKVRQLIRQLALISNTKMSKELEDKVYQQIKKYNINGNNIKALSSMLKGKF